MNLFSKIVKNNVHHINHLKHFKYKFNKYQVSHSSNQLCLLYSKLTQVKRESKLVYLRILSNNPISFKRAVKIVLNRILPWVKHAFK